LCASIKMKQKRNEKSKKGKRLTIFFGLICVLAWNHFRKDMRKFAVFCMSEVMAEVLAEKLGEYIGKNFVRLPRFRP